MNKETLRRWKCEQLLEKATVDSNGCMLWPGPFERGGYGKSTAFNKTIIVHRFIGLYYLLPDEQSRETTTLKVRHTCDNPPCINPKHLVLGTSADNTRDMLDRGRAPSGTKHPFSKLTNEQVREIRKLWQGDGREYMTQRALAARYGVSQRAIEFIVHNQSYKDV